MKEEIIKLPTRELHFDRKNPRLVEFGIGPRSTDEEILQILWDEMDVMELIQSISASGFFPHEALIVTKEKGKYIVIEGNRRLAALKILLDPQLAKENNWTVEPISDEAKSALEQIPCIVSTREESWRYLGFKHVNGPAKWTSYAKAAYIAHIHNTYNIPLNEIAKQIGDRHRTVQKLYRGLMVLKEAEKYGVYNREDRWNKHLAFSHLYTGLEREGIKNFLDLKPMEDESPEPVPEDKLKELGDLLTWLYGNKKENKPPVIRSQNPDLKYLDQIVTSKEAIVILKETNDIDIAYEASIPSQSVFEDSIIKAKHYLQKAQANLTTGYSGSDELLRLAAEIADIADDLYEQMEKKTRPQRRKKRRSEDL